MNNYENAGSVNRISSGPKTADRPRLSMQLDQLGKVLAECHNCAGAIEQAADRVLGPTPQEAEKSIAVPPADTIERRLAELIGIAEVLGVRLQHANNRLDSAV